MVAVGRVSLPRHVQTRAFTDTLVRGSHDVCAAGCATLWLSTWIVLLQSESETEEFVSNHVRLTSLGVLITLQGVNLVPVAMALRVWIVASHRLPGIIAASAFGVAWLAMWWISCRLMKTIFKVTWGELFKKVYPGSFAFLPGTYKLHLTRSE